MDQIVEPTGPFGRFQKVNLVIVGCFTALSAMYFNLILINYIEPDVKCKIRDDLYNTSEYSSYENYTMCDMWNSHAERLSINSKSPFICKVDNSTYGLNVVSEWNLVCKNQYLATITQSLYLIGTLCAFLTEIVVNKYGRRKTSMIFVLTLISLAFISQALMSDIKMIAIKDHQVKFIVYSIMQPVLGILIYALSVSTYLHLIELTTCQYHKFFSNMNVLFYLAGEIGSLAIYYYTKNWKLTNWSFILFAILTFAAFNFFVLESPRWLIESSQYEEGFEILKKMARFNKKKTLDSPKFKDYLLKQMQTNIVDRSRENSDLEDQLEQINKPKIEPKEITFAQKICAPRDNVIKIISLIVLFNCLSVNFFGASISIVNVTHLDKFLIILLSSIFGSFGALACSINKKTGYKSALLLFLFISGLTSVLVITIPDQHEINWILITKISSGLLGKSAIVAAYNTAIIFAAESYDRKIKLNLIVLLNCAGCILTIAAPQVNLLRIIWKPLPYVVYTVCSIICFIIVNNLPEPRNLQKKKKLSYM